MADSKITALTELTDPASADLLAIVDDVAVTPTTKKVEIDSLDDYFSASAKTLTNKTLTSPTITGTPVLNVDSAVPFYGDSMSRQAIINGNFDVWQRGTSVSIVDNTTTFGADRFSDFARKDNGTLPTLTRTKEVLTYGDIPNSFYYSRLTTNGAGSSLGTESEHSYRQLIENGTRYLCGDGKKVTVSFYARSSIANKRIGLYLFQQYGSGGSPTPSEIINGTNWTLTSTWTKYTYTFTTNTLVGKTFGTANDDSLRLRLDYMWGSNYQSRYGSSTAETYVGSGTIDIAQVQLCAGDVALPFQPKSFEEELRACQRYYEKSFDYSYTPTNSTAINMHPHMASGMEAKRVTTRVAYKVVKHKVATITTYSRAAITSGTTNMAFTQVTSAYDFEGDLATGDVVGNGTDGFCFRSGTLSASYSTIFFGWTADAEL